MLKLKQHYTILGSQGFIGSHLMQYLRQLGHHVITPTRSLTSNVNELKKLTLGHIIYCIGLTADFRDKPYETIEAHVVLLSKILSECEFESLTYLSSTRVYHDSPHTTEDSHLYVNPCNREDIYNLSKLVGESLCNNSSKKCRIVRLSNVYGKFYEAKNFLTFVLLEAAKTENVVLHTSPHSAKDYISIQDVIVLLEKISSSGGEPIYNLASGQNISNRSLQLSLENLGINVHYSPNARTIIFPEIDISRIKMEFYVPRYNVLNDIPYLLDFYKNKSVN